MSKRIARTLLVTLFVPVSIHAQENLVPLSTVVKRVVELDPGVRARQAEKEAARSETLRVRSTRLPKLYVSTDVGSGQIVNDLANVLLTGLSPASVTDPKTRSRLADLSSSRPYFVPGARLEDNLFDGGATSAAIRSATLNESKAEVAGKSAAQDVAFTAASDFLGLAQGRVLGRYLEEYVHVAGLVATALEDQAKAGRITDAKALAGRAKLAAAQAALENNRDDLLVLSGLLRQRAGLPADTAIDTRWLESKLSESGLFPLPQTFETEKNVSLQDSSLDVQIQEQDLHAAKARRIPDVKFVAEYGFSFSALVFTFRPGYDVGLRVNYPLFTSRELERNIQVQQRRLDAANLRREEVAAGLRDDQIRMLAEGRKLGRQYEAAHSALAQAEEVYRVARLKYDQGAGAPADLLDAADLVSTARQRCLDLVRSSLLLRWTALRSEDALLAELEQGAQP